MINYKELSYSMFEYISIIILDFYWLRTSWKFRSGIRTSCQNCLSYKFVNKSVEINGLRSNLMYIKSGDQELILKTFIV